MARYEAVIFALDGVICSTEEFQFQAWKRIADELDIPFDRSVSSRIRGVSRGESLDIVLEKDQGEPYTEAEKRSLAADKNEIYRELLEQLSEKDLSAEVKSTLDALRGKGLALAVASSSENARLILSKIGLGTYFDAVTDGGQVRRVKPDPEVYLRTAEALGVPPGRCLAVEGAAVGAEAACAAGMDVACLGGAVEPKAGDYSLRSFSGLLTSVEF